jgi:hypothetical protein
LTTTTQTTTANNLVATNTETSDIPSQGFNYLWLFGFLPVIILVLGLILVKRRKPESNSHGNTSDPNRGVYSDDAISVLRKGGANLHQHSMNNANSIAAAAILASGLSEPLKQTSVESIDKRNKSRVQESMDDLDEITDAYAGLSVNSPVKTRDIYASDTIKQRQGAKASPTRYIFTSDTVKESKGKISREIPPTTMMLKEFGFGDGIEIPKLIKTGPKIHSNERDRFFVAPLPTSNQKLQDGRRNDTTKTNVSSVKTKSPDRRMSEVSVETDFFDSDDERFQRNQESVISSVVYKEHGELVVGSLAQVMPKSSILSMKRSEVTEDSDDSERKVRGVSIISDMDGLPIMGGISEFMPSIGLKLDEKEQDFKLTESNPKVRGMSIISDADDIVKMPKTSPSLLSKPSFISSADLESEESVGSSIPSSLDAVDHPNVGKPMSTKGIFDAPSVKSTELYAYPIIESNEDLQERPCELYTNTINSKIAQDKAPTELYAFPITKESQNTQTRSKSANDTALSTNLDSISSLEKGFEKEKPFVAKNWKPRVRGSSVNRESSFERLGQSATPGASANLLGIVSGTNSRMLKDENIDQRNRTIFSKFTGIFSKSTTDADENYISPPSDNLAKIGSKSSSDSVEDERSTSPHTKPKSTSSSSKSNIDQQQNSSANLTNLVSQRNNSSANDELSTSPHSNSKSIYENINPNGPRSYSMDTEIENLDSIKLELSPDSLPFSSASIELDDDDTSKAIDIDLYSPAVVSETTLTRVIDSDTKKVDVKDEATNCTILLIK